MLEVAIAALVPVLQADGVAVSATFSMGVNARVQAEFEM